MTDIRLYDTMARRKRVFTPANPDRVTMYVCGPTVYNRAHIGNARPAVVFDVLYRLLRHTYPDREIVYARNFTDIDDKIMVAAEKEGVPIATITRRYEDFYTKDMAALGVTAPTLTPRATENVDAMIAMIASLIEKGAAYAADGHVLFDITKDAEYGSLSRRPMDEMIAGARVEVAPYKKNPGDFVLWKPSRAEQDGWESPWGYGRPGWHIECSAMIEKHLGTTIDIHGGGLDLQFPHHENECAQSRCTHGGAPLANFWMHNGFLSMDREKMSKSLGNVVTVGELLEQGHRGEVLRLALLTAHYRQPLDWNERRIEEAKKMLGRWYRALRDAPALTPAIDPQFVEALANDLNTPAAVGRMSELFAAGDIAALAGSAQLLGLLGEDAAEWFKVDISAVPSGTGKVSATLTDAGIDDRIAARLEAKKAKNWAEADRIRDELKAEAITLEDRPDGTTDWRRG